MSQTMVADASDPLEQVEQGTTHGFFDE